nr:MAG TPA_asm: hypothetical protein [Caudoviricetes sp.]
MVRKNISLITKWNQRKIRWRRRPKGDSLIQHSTLNIQH